MGAPRAEAACRQARRGACPRDDVLSSALCFCGTAPPPLQAALDQAPPGSPFWRSRRGWLDCAVVAAACLALPLRGVPWAAAALNSLRPLRLFTRVPQMEVGVGLSRAAGRQLRCAVAEQAVPLSRQAVPPRGSCAPPGLPPHGRSPRRMAACLPLTHALTPHPLLRPSSKRQPGRAQAVVHGLAASVAAVGRVLLVSAVFLLAWAALGLQLFMGRVQACTSAACCADPLDAATCMASRVGGPHSGGRGSSWWAAGLFCLASMPAGAAANSRSSCPAHPPGAGAAPTTPPRPTHPARARAGGAGAGAVPGLEPRDLRRPAGPPVRVGDLALQLRQVSASCQHWRWGCLAGAGAPRGLQHSAPQQRPPCHPDCTRSARPARSLWNAIVTLFVSLTGAGWADAMYHAAGTNQAGQQLQQTASASGRRGGGGGAGRARMHTPPTPPVLTGHPRHQRLRMHLGPAPKGAALTARARLPGPAPPRAQVWGPFFFVVYQMLAQFFIFNLWVARARQPALLPGRQRAPAAQRAAATAAAAASAPSPPCEPRPADPPQVRLLDSRCLRRHRGCSQVSAAERRPEGLGPGSHVPVGWRGRARPRRGARADPALARAPAPAGRGEEAEGAAPLRTQPAGQPAGMPACCCTGQPSRRAAGSGGGGGGGGDGIPALPLRCHPRRTPGSSGPWCCASSAPASCSACSTTSRGRRGVRCGGGAVVAGRETSRRSVQPAHAALCGLPPLARSLEPPGAALPPPLLTPGMLLTRLVSRARFRRDACRAGHLHRQRGADGALLHRVAAQGRGAGAGLLAQPLAPVRLPGHLGLGPQ